jgi:carboxyl-terminal processing protease
VRIRDDRSTAWGVIRGVVAGAALALSSATAVGGQDDLAAVERIVEWSDDVWRAASVGATDETIRLLTRAPGVSGHPQADTYLSSVEQYQLHLSERDRRRAERIEEIDGELSEAMAGGEIEEALNAALELQLLAEDEGAALQRQEVRRAIELAMRASAEAEARGDWLEAYALYSRLHLLHEETRRFADDELRLRDRLTMIRVYTPELFHDMQSARRVAKGEEPLPPFNPTGEDWRANWAAIDGTMIKQALHQAARRHVDRKPVRDILIGGFERVVTLVRTTDLAEALPTLEDRAAVERFVEAIRGYQAALREKRDVGPYDVFRSVDGLLKANEKTVAIDRRALLHEFGTGAAATLDDFSSFYWPDELESFSRTTEGSFTGVGIQISMNEAREITVVTPVADTPAARAGIRPEDVIAEVDGSPTLGMGLTQVVQQIIGPAGSRVTLGVEREGEPEMLDFELTRAVIPLYSVKGWQRIGPSEDDWSWFVDDEHDIGYIRLTQFRKHSTRDLRAAVRDITREGARGLILDLRFNGGGLLDEAVGVSNVFLDAGVIVTQEDADGRVAGRESARGGRALLTDLPMVVLVNGSSASASEIVAGALQDHDRAVIVGDRTYGKGSVQNVFMLAGNQAAFKLTTQYYKLPGGRLIHRKDGAKTWGVEPDVVVEALPEQVGDALSLRQRADIVEFDDRGRLIEDPERPRPEELLTSGVDPQLETAVLLLQSRALRDEMVRQASLN